MLVGQEGRAASLVLGSLGLAELFVKVRLWQFSSKDWNMQVAAGIAASGHIQACRVIEYFQR